MSEGKLAGRTAIVTGGSRGIGYGIAQRLIQDGARVVITGRKPEPLAEAVAALGGAERALGIAGKADDPEHQADVVARTIETFGSADLLVNNAGINPAASPLIDLDLGAARKTVEVNCLAAISWTQQIHRAWMKEHGGAIVNVSSVASLSPTPLLAIYGASKAMLNYITTEFAVELGPNVRVNGVQPAVVKTDFAKLLYEGREEQVSTPYPLKRLGTPDDIAGAVSYLLSEDASWVTGQLLTLDGGVSLVSGEKA